MSGNAVNSEQVGVYMKTEEAEQQVIPGLFKEIKAIQEIVKDQASAGIIRRDGQDSCVKKHTVSGCFFFSVSHETAP